MNQEPASKKVANRERKDSAIHPKGMSVYPGMMLTGMSLISSSPQTLLTTLSTLKGNREQKSLCPKDSIWPSSPKRVVLAAVQDAFISLTRSYILPR